MDCATAMHRARVQCNGKRGDEYDACCATMGLRTHSTDPRNELTCCVDGQTKSYYLSHDDGKGQTQRVHGMQMRGQVTRLR